MSTSDSILTERAEEAIRCINTTQAPIFLTGNAGTGKTTFLKNLSQYTHKKLIIVAPTGIAALNAGGTTIHSQFLLPFGFFIPGRNQVTESFNGNGSYNQHILARKHPLNGQRKKILRSIDLLVIDEVSMLRADLLDAIDYRLRSARGNFYQPFGGVQVLFIGDLHQLPPVLKREDEALLLTHYNSPWFFESHCLKSLSLFYIELDKIFRQQDDEFIRILNNLRHNRATYEDYELLNKHFRPGLDISQVKEIITLTTHNRQADQINQLALEELPGKTYRYEANLTGDFPESMYPVPITLFFKKGSQVMFVKNDTDKKAYFNGRLASITDISEEEIEVRMHDNGTQLSVSPQSWENKKYDIHPETQEVTEQVIGTFEQLPIKLAWAITIHKSQGLTFDRAIIDPGRAFADGQVYVALSRLRSLNGLILKTKIHAGVVSTDQLVVRFSENQKNEKSPDELRKRQLEYAGQRLMSAFDLDPILKLINRNSQDEIGNQRDEPFKILSESIFLQKNTSEKFREQLLRLLGDENINQLNERLNKGIEFFQNLIWHWMEMIMNISLTQWKKKKNYNSLADELDHLFMNQLMEIERLPVILKGVLSGQEINLEHFKNTDTARLQKRKDLLEKYQHLQVQENQKLKTKAGSKKSHQKHNKKTPSYQVSVALLKAGKDTPSIAEERRLTTGTIEQHLLEALSKGEIAFSDWILTEEEEIVARAFKNLKDSNSLKELFSATGGQVSYGRLRAILWKLESDKNGTKNVDE